jgi:methylated-DNA-[protein]-cysteine S-methyltransferase
MIESSGPLAQLTEVDQVTLARLHHRLEQRATESGLLDVAFRTIDSPVGLLLLAATPLGLVRVAYQREGLDAVLQALASKISPRILAAPGRLEDAARQLDDYFAGRRTTFQIPLDLRLSAGFRRTVLDHLAAISYGHTESYAEVAAATGHPGAMRAVGSACATNPLPVVVPCHRVLRSDGSLGGYLGGLEVKRALLELEQRRRRHDQPARAGLQ